MSETNIHPPALDIRTVFLTAGKICMIFINVFVMCLHMIYYDTIMAILISMVKYTFKRVNYSYSEFIQP